MAGIQTPAPAPSAPQAAPQAPQEAPPVEPGSIPWLHPTDRPNEPVTSGLSLGAGPGVEAMGPMTDMSHRHLADILDIAAAHPTATPKVMALAEIARMLRS